MPRSGDLQRQLFAEFPVTLEMPLAAHRLPASPEFFAMQQNPEAPARRAGAVAAIVLGEPTVDVGGPTDVSQTAGRRLASEDVDEAGHAPILSDSP